MLHLAAVAVATSSTFDRRWVAAGVQQHHLIDPTTGRPSTFAKAATVVAATGWEAEIAAKTAVLAAAERRDVLLAPVTAGALVTDGAATQPWGSIDRFLHPAPEGTA